MAQALTWYADWKVRMSLNPPPLALVVDNGPPGTMPATAWRVPYGWLLILVEKKRLGGAKHYRDIGPEVTYAGACHIRAEELRANDRLDHAWLRSKDFDPYVDRHWKSNRPRPERDHDLVPERVRLDAELEEDDS